MNTKFANYLKSSSQIHYKSKPNFLQFTPIPLSQPTKVPILANLPTKHCEMNIYQKVSPKAQTALGFARGERGVSLLDFKIQ